MFTANGLLGPSSLPKAQILKDIPESAGAATMFVSNGLLGCSVAGGKESGSHELDTTSPNTDQVPMLSFAPNGLLSNGITHPVSLTRNTPCDEPPAFSLSESQDDLPSVSEAFGAPKGLLAHSKHSTSTIPRIPRSTIQATTYDGKTIYLRKKAKACPPQNNIASSSSSTQGLGNLLDVPIHRLMDQLSATTAANLQRERTEHIVQPEAPRTNAVEDTLWVDRYRPHKFADLVGNERVARDAMTWVKQWDWCVFGKQRGKKRSRDSDENVNLDEYHRPQEKVLLLSGPPGLGKTTMAHVIARQAGYEVMEINASDARSGSVVDDRIRPTLESGSAVGSSKPVLLIIDEIDGATGAGENSNTFIHRLVQLIYYRPRKSQRPGQKRDQHAKRPILRPIICICNDHNASSLAKLRPHAFQIRFNRPADTQIVKRLKEICIIEGLKADSRALSTLVSVAKGDLRGCLNTLQFVKTRNESVTETVIRKATTGMKEADSTVISVINSLFAPLSKKRVKELALTDEEEARYVARLCREIDGSGRESYIASGCFGHYATLRQHDANLSRHEQANEWLTTYDRFSSAMYSDGEFALLQYLPYTLVPFYPLFQERGGARVERNQADWEHLQLTRSNEEIYKSFSRCLRTATVRHGGDFRHLVSTPILELEFAPFINRIISPPLRPVNSQVIRPQEKALMTRLVDIMAALELRFIPERAEDGQLSYRLDPPIDVFVTYDGKRPADITVSRFAVRQIVSGEIDAKLIARDTDYVEKGKRGKHEFFGKSARIDGKGKDAHTTSDQANKRAKVDIADKPPVDFFGRLITVQSASTTKAAARKNVEKKYRVTYKFLEGNSAAVRRPVKVSMFL
ncbi:P-loop containing nucleoside triphosphate hydrolase protein [Crassisporium funariophilum]|nr:P-loop containing nucleoside triphosphate hydrolase protein [Crassisporium funariophilum]